jgi:DNA segregation ATPase FtsK/SpoIIIE-like protein
MKDVSEMSLQEIREAAEAAERAAAEPEAETVYRRTVKDPDGVERLYESHSMEGLVDAIVADRAEHQPTEIKPPAARTGDEEFILAQEFATTPSKAFEKMLAETTGAPVSDLKSRMAKLAQYEANESAEQFVASHPEYYATPVNGARIQKAMQEANMPATLENITKVYESLRDKNLLVERPPEIDPYAIPLESLRNLAMGREDSEVDF